MKMSELKGRNEIKQNEKANSKYKEQEITLSAESRDEARRSAPYWMKRC